MRLKGKILIAAGWTALVGLCDYLYVKNALNNYAMMFFIEEGKAMVDEHETNDSCLTTILAKGYDIDGIKSLELTVDGESYFRRELESPRDYSIIMNICNPKLTYGKHELSVEITDINGDTEREEATLNVIGGAYIL